MTILDETARAFALDTAAPLLLLPDLLCAKKRFDQLQNKLNGDDFLITELDRETSLHDMH